MRCVLAVSAALLLTMVLEPGEARANPALIAAKAAQAAQAASRAAQAGRAASAASRMSRLGSKMGRIGTRVMRRVMSGRNIGGGILKPNSMRMRMQRALKQRGLRNMQKLAAQRNKNFRQLLKKRMSGLRSGAAVKNFARNQVQKRMQTMNRMMKDRRFAMRKLQSLQRRSRVESNQRDADRRRMMRSHASEMRRRASQTGMFKSAVLSHTAAR